MRIRELILRRAKARPAICHPDRRVSDVLETMAREGLTVIPVVEHGEVLAILSYGELLVGQQQETKDTLTKHGYVTQDFSRPKPLVEMEGFRN